MQKLLTFFFAKNISVYAIFIDQGFNDTLINDIVSFEQLGSDHHVQMCSLITAYSVPRFILLYQSILLACNTKLGPEMSKSIYSEN